MQLAAGIVTSGRMTQGGTTQFEIGNISVSASSLAAISINASSISFLATLFSGDDVLYGTSNPDVLRGYEGNDTLIGSAGSDTLQGDEGNDTLIGGLGTNTISGGDGVDTAVVGALFRQATLAGPNGNGTVTGAGFKDTLSGIESIRFIDGTLSYDVGVGAATVLRLYQAGLGRAPDGAGLSFWTTQLLNGASPTQLAQSFLTSTEFLTRFPAASQGGAAFVTQLYQNVLGRAPDQEGLAFWTTGLASARVSTAGVLFALSDSTENRSNTAARTNAGVWVPDQQASQVARLYYTTLGRAPDAGGLTFWTNALKSGTPLLDQALAFTQSTEFVGRYGALSNSAFVSTLYVNVLGRAGEAAGQAFWTGALDRNASSRAGLVASFSESAEHQARRALVTDDRGVTLA